MAAQVDEKARDSVATERSRRSGDHATVPA